MRKHFTKVRTHDGSPTFSYLNKELMHNKSGAFSETVHSYLPVLFALKKSGLSYKLTSIGLGLAYIEILCIAYFVKNCIDLSSFVLYSYESDSFLRHSFQKYCLGTLESSEMTEIYKSIVMRSAQYFQISKKSIQDLLKLAIKKKIILKPSFTEKSKNQETSHGLFFDAFSPKTSNNIWSKESLDNLFSSRISEKKCILSSYAKNRLLKEALKQHKFRDIHKAGFEKRHCTYAIRGIS